MAQNFSKNRQSRFSQILIKKLSSIDEQENTNNQQNQEQNIQLDQELPIRQLHAKNPNNPKIQAINNYLTKETQRIEIVSQLIVHYSQDSNLILQDSDEFKIQEESQNDKEKQLRQIVQKHNLVQNQGFLQNQTPEEL